MKAVIMAGGFGTRLRPLTANIPKPMVPMAGRPVMEHIVYLLRESNISDITAILYFQSEQIKEYFGDGREWGVSIKYTTATADFGTAGSVKSAEKNLKSRFIVISGDVLTDFDLNQAIDFHIKKKALATIVLTRVENPLDYGIVITGRTGKITRFLEKPGWGQVFSDTVNTGIYILEPEIFKLIPPETEFDFSRDLFPKMLEKKMKLYGYVAPGYWRDIGNIEEYFTGHQDIFEGKVKVRIGGKKEADEKAELFVGEGAMISHGSQFSGTVVIGNGARIGPRARIFNSVIGEGSIIGRDANLNRVVSWDKVSIGPRAQISEAIICSNGFVGEAATVEEECIVSDDARVGDGAWVKRRVKIWPNKEVEAGATLTSSLIWGERWSRELFSDAKVSGVGNAEITPELSAKLGAAFGAVIGKGRSVAVCRGASDAARMINRSVVCGMLSAGVNVADLRTIPIPVLRQELKSGRMAGGIHVRLNPDGNDEIDIIFFDHDGRDLPVPRAKSIERLFFREDFRRASVDDTGSLDFPQRAYETYRESFVNHIDKSVFLNSKFKAVVDYGFGNAAEILPGILGTLGIDTISLNAFVDPRQSFYFENRQREATRQLGTIVKSLGADIGILLNSGAEKIIAVSEKGEVIGPGRLLLKVTRLYCEAERPRRIAVPVTAPAGIEKIAEEFDAKIERIPSDHQAMMQAGGAGDSIFVGGTKGGFIFPGFQLGVDGMFATAKIFELLVKADRKIGQITGPWEKLTTVSKDVACSWGKKGQVMRALIEHSRRFNRILVDGARISEKSGWVLVRPDRKKALFTVQAESASAEKAGELLKKYIKLVKDWQK
jgi:mannose-1-phosphate guanylyltransferase/phosphomannomutase